MKTEKIEKLVITHITNIAHMINSEHVIVEPFNPSQIDVDISVVNLGYLLDKLQYGEINLQPEFQRASDLWNTTQKSRLIESILLGLPLPSFYFNEYIDESEKIKKLQVIDGLQRLCALRDFVIEKKLRLTDLQFLQQDYEGKYYDNLTRADLMNIRSLKITINTLRKDTPSKVKYLIFQRVNTAGLPLTSPEMRYALNQGVAIKMLTKMMDLRSFKQATSFYFEKKRRMEDFDYVNRFVAFYRNVFGYTGEMEKFLSDELDAINKNMIDEDMCQLVDVFDKTMKTCYLIWGSDSFRKRTDLNHRRKPLSKAVFEALSVNIAVLTDLKRQLLIKNKTIVTKEMMLLFNNPDFNKSISAGSDKKGMVLKRFEDIKNLLDNILDVC